MTKFFVQFLLSVMIGISAAVGFSSEARGELKHAVREARILAQGTAQTALKTVSDLFTDTAVKFDVSAKGNANANSSSTNAQENKLLTGAGNLNLDSTPAINLDGSPSANTRTKTDAKVQDAGLSSQDKVKSTLDLNFGFGN